MRRNALLVIAVAAMLRIALATTIGLGVDESYAVAVARPFSLSYFDHPPLAFWLAGGMATLFPHASDLVLRLPFILLFAATSWTIFRLTAHLFSERAGFYATILLNIMPVFGVSTGSWVLPDGPLMCATAAAALCLAHVFFEADGADGQGQQALRDRRGTGEATRWWLLAGVAAGCALLSKYHGALFLVGVLLFVVTQRQARSWLTRPQPYVAVAIALALGLPVLIWNAQHGWASFRFQGGRAHGAAGLHLTAFLQNLAGQAGYILPWLWVPLVWQLGRGIVTGPRDARRWFLVCLAIIPVAGFTLVSLGGNPGLPHWPAPGYLFVVPLLGAAVVSAEDRVGAKRIRGWLVVASATSVALIAFLASDIRTGWVNRLTPSLFLRGDPALEALDWRELRGALAARGIALDGTQLIVATHWIDAAKLGLALQPAAYVVCVSDDPRHFRYRADNAKYVGRDGLLIVRVPVGDSVDQGALNRARPFFQSLTPLGLVPIHRAGVPVITLALYSGHSLIAPGPAP